MPQRLLILIKLLFGSYGCLFIFPRFFFFFFFLPFFYENGDKFRSYKNIHSKKLITEFRIFSAEKSLLKQHLPHYLANTNTKSTEFILFLSS